MLNAFWPFILLVVYETHGQATFQASFRACTNSTVQLARWPYCTNDPSNKTAIPIDVFQVSAWTYNSVGCPTGTHRAFVVFSSMETIPSYATIESATLKLFGIGPDGRYPEGPFTTYSNSVFNQFGSNAIKVTRLLTPWDPLNVTWNTQPASDIDAVTMPASNVSYYYNPVVDVTRLVRCMVSLRNFAGFRLALDTEVYYRRMVFFSSLAANPSVRPLLEVSYTVSRPTRR